MSLQKAIEAYKAQPLLDLYEVKLYFEDMSLEEAIISAAESIDRDGKMYSHQRRIGRETCGKSASELLKHYDDIERARSFKELYKITSRVQFKVRRLGELWNYDTALRIGFNLGLYPEAVYIQCGVEKGVNKVDPNLKCKGPLPLHKFPDECQELNEYELENFLCIYGKKTYSNRSCC